jgi:hypothetical protein
LPTRRPREMNHPDVAMLRKFHVYKVKRDEAAAKLQIDPTLIGAKAELLDLARDERAGRKQMMPWQLELLGVK